MQADMFFQIRKREQWGREKEEQNSRESRVCKQEIMGMCDRKSLQLLNFFVCKFRVRKGFNSYIFCALQSPKQRKKFYKPLEIFSNL